MMLKDASKLNKVLGAENFSVYIDFELTQPGFVAKLRKFASKCFLPPVGFEPPLRIVDFRAALITALTLFFVHFSCMFANLALNKLHESIIPILS